MQERYEWNEAEKQRLMDAAARKAGLDPEAVRRQLKRGAFEGALDRLHATDSEMIGNLLRSSGVVEKLLEGPGAQRLLNELMKEE